MCLIVTILLRLSLSFKELHLHLRVIKFGVGVDELMFVDKKFKSLRETPLSPVPFKYIYNRDVFSHSSTMTRTLEADQNVRSSKIRKLLIVLFALLISVGALDN